MKKYIIYIGILLAGLLLGWLLFGNSSHPEKAENLSEATENNKKWTCSMHPQIMQPEFGDCPICGMDLIPAESSADGLMIDQFKLTENAMALANIQTSTVGNVISDVDKGNVLSGKITENEDERATMPAHFNGRVEKLYVKSIGELVNKGQAIAEIYSPELIAAQQELLIAYKLKAAQPQLYKAVKNKFKNWMIRGALLDEVEQTGKVKNSFTIYSHVSGVVTEIAINEGSHIMDGKPILKVSNLKSVWANFDVYEHQINQFKKGQSIVITTNTASNKKIEAKVDFINPILDTKTRTVKLRVVLNNKSNIFKPGMFVEGKIKGIPSDKEEVLTIPATAVLWTGERSLVYLKTNLNESVFEMREITLGNKVGSNYEVLKGLKTGDEIVTNGTFTVDAAAQLQGKKSMMNKGNKTTTNIEEYHVMEMKNERIKVSVEFQNQLKVVFDGYIKLKDALVKDNSKKTQEESKKLVADLAKINKKLLKKKEAHTHWMFVEKELNKKAISISNTTNIKEQRNDFKDLSDNITNALEVFGINEKVYYQFCPMADNDKGAYWLSKEAQILNPYFGDAMLKCGEVKQVIE